MEPPLVYSDPRPHSFAAPDTPGGPSVKHGDGRSGSLRGTATSVGDLVWGVLNVFSRVTILFTSGNWETVVPTCALFGAVVRSPWAWCSSQLWA